MIRESSDTTISFDGTTARLTITKCKMSHSAVYKVVAKNEFGEDESSATLTVTEKKEKKKKEEEEEEVIEEEIEEKKEEKVRIITICVSIICPITYKKKINLKS